MAGLLFLAMGITTAILCVRDGAGIAETILWSGFFLGAGAVYYFVAFMCRNKG